MVKLGRVIVIVGGLVGALFSAAAAYLLTGPAPLPVALAALIGAAIYGGLWRQQRRISARGNQRRAR